jgi:hypothetical protein
MRAAMEHLALSPVAHIASVDQQQIVASTHQEHHRRMMAIN